MFSWKEFEKLKQVLSQAGGDRYKAEGGQHHLSIRPTEILDWVEFLKEDLGYLTMVEIAGEDLGLAAQPRFEIVYHVLNMGTHQRINLHLKLNDGEVIPSVRAHYAHAEWMEREQAELLNLKFDLETLPLILPNGQKNFPLRKDSEIKNWPEEKSLPLPKLPMNPNKSEAPYPEESYRWEKFEVLSPMAKGDFEWLVCFDPAKVVDSQMRIGFHHQGVESLLQSKDVLQTLQLVDKINLSAAPTYSIAWARTLEDMFRIKIPERAQAIRIVMLELARISDHLTVLAKICAAISQSEQKLFLDAREKIYELFEKYSGHRQGLSVARIGGVREDFPHGWIVEYQSVADTLSKSLRLIHKSLIGQNNFRKLLESEPVNAQSVLQWGVSGPAMRAAGLNFDLRKSQPFYFYQDIDFDIPVGIHGAIYDRYLIRYEELQQSLRIITQVIDNLPLGEVVNEQYASHYGELVKTLQSSELHHSWHYSSLESPNGEAGFLLHLGKDLRPERMKIKTPSFSIAQALPIFVRGLSREQLKVGMESLSLVRWEMDR